MRGKNVLYVVFFLFLAGRHDQVFATLYNDGNIEVNGQQVSLIYDDSTNMTWLDYSFESASWSIANDRATQLSLDINGLLYDDWRLPETVQGVSGEWSGTDGTTTAGYNITSSEMGYLFYEALGNQSPFDVTGHYRGAQNDNNPDGDDPWGLVETGPFCNLVAEKYWSLTIVDEQAGDEHWMFDFHTGGQSPLSNGFWAASLVVREGRVLTNVPVPEPSTWLFFCLGLAGLFRCRTSPGKIRLNE